MIRKIITVSILLATLVSITSVMHIASAAEPELKLDISAYEGDLIGSKAIPSHAFSWTPDLTLRKKVINIYERLLSPTTLGPEEFSSSIDESNQRLFSFEVYQGDGLDDLRSNSHNNITLPDEDTSAYGVTVKQRF
ncbi:MAG: hypothetical protein AAF304_08365 [Pseudomonadota bacterium]